MDTSLWICAALIAVGVLAVVWVEMRIRRSRRKLDAEMRSLTRGEVRIYTGGIFDRDVQ